ncbi:hypothetical protein I203_108205 [Kwoniella mangroviensis CBS 8507]|uniref:hypothetical protein n=1 Tax=Kwoniella mangroviensis CBS 8507 TaxID=1296122 RepID=UPI00080D7235|nr:uncharacterized protein I203_05099 [Kwoniella mangroviensis CBS 8507]OCF66074.1 hypothetical protein I203_05099 [Kwoniella mangroviensis CBS 8507]
MTLNRCDACADTVKKPKLDQHRNRCHASFTCLDCSTTFRNPGEYKSHTTCVSEAEKYQGALYKGPKKNGQTQTSSQFQNPAAPSPAPASTPAAAAEPAPTAASSSIHPSRLNQLNAPEPQYSQRGGPPGRGGRGGRGGFQRGSFGRGGGFAGFERSYATDMNKMAPSSGMRSWGGSPAETTPNPEAPSATEVAQSNIVPSSSVNGDADADKKKKRSRKGDKGGTGAKANSKNPKNDDNAQSSEPQNKKRKFEESETTAIPATAMNGESTDVPSKTIKRLKKRFGKLEEKELTLGQWIDALGKDKERNVDSSDILKALKVTKKDGHFVLTI